MVSLMLNLAGLDKNHIKDMWDSEYVGIWRVTLGKSLGNHLLLGLGHVGRTFPKKTHRSSRRSGQKTPRHFN